jgi:pimeloyl-ACP methyl ester carboxylesterase
VGELSGRPTGGAAGVADLVSGVKAAARRIANFATYNEMKQRAGIVGATGVASLIDAIRDRQKSVKIHLVGHSFGGRLVTAASNALPRGTPLVSVSLLQAAFSHNGLATKYDGEHDGAFHALVAEQRASGPIIITHTKNDRAVGVAYPLASRISRDQASALGDKDDPYGGMGRNGAQKMGPETTDGTLLRPGRPYAFASGKVYNLNADETIANHGDVANEPVAYAVLNAAKAL